MPGWKEPEVMVAVSAMCAADENDAIHWSRETADQRKRNLEEHSNEQSTSTDTDTVRTKLRVPLPMKRTIK